MALIASFRFSTASPGNVAIAAPNEYQFQGSKVLFIRYSRFPDSSRPRVSLKKKRRETPVYIGFKTMLSRVKKKKMTSGAMAKAIAHTMFFSTTTFN